MSYRIFMLIKRGITDETPVCVFPWERPILEEVHGGGAQVITIDAMATFKDAASVRQIKLPSKGEREEIETGKALKVDKLPSLLEQLKAMTVVDPDEDPFLDLDMEYGRLQGKYGMHPEVSIPMVEKVFGGARQFKQAVQAYRGSKPPKIDPMYEHDQAEEEIDEDKSPAAMSVRELKAALDRRQIEYKGNASQEVLAELLTESIAAATA